LNLQPVASAWHGQEERKNMMVMVILPIFVIIALIGTLPIWPHSKKWGFFPLGAVSVFILIILFLVWTGRY
jgi:hypothetical protein